MKITNMAFAANMVVNQILEIQKGETVLIITDTDRPRIITEALAYSAVSAGGDVTVAIMRPQLVGGAEPTSPIAAAMAASQVIINQATYSIVHTDATRTALANGARCANLRNFTEEMMVNGGVTADYYQVKRVSDNLASMLTAADKIRLTTPEGTDLTVYTKGRAAIAQTGFATKPGEFSGLPDGESTLAPLEGRSEGVVVNPYIADLIGLMTEPFRMEISKGRIVKVEGGKQADALVKHLANNDANGYNAAGQFALGTNPACRIMPNTREVSKKLGTAHIAIGDNVSLGGTSNSSFHIDFVFLKPSVYLDDVCILKDGEYLVDLGG